MVLLGTISFGCRKTEDDPLFSLRTRKGRVAGEWKVTSAQGIYAETPVNGNTTTTKWNLDGSTMTETDEFGYVTTAPRTVEYVFERDGTFTITDTENGAVSTVKGRWNFNEGAGEAKAKTQLVIFNTEIIDTSGTYTASGYSAQYTFDIIELRHKKMVLKYLNDITYPWSSKYRYEETWVLEAK